MHKVFRINKYFCLGLTTIAVLGTQIVKANDEIFQNNLLKMDVRKTPLGGVKVMLYTTKPYKDAVIVNKKSDNEYVILMPETASTMTSKPALNSTADVLSKIDVKTQQYGAAQGQKGYTKIIISTLKPIEITSQIETLGVAQYKLSEKEAKELLEQAGKKHVSAPAKQSQKIVAKAPTTQTVKTPKTTVEPALKTTKKVAPKGAEKDTKKATKIIAQKPVPTEQTLTKQNPQKQTATKKTPETVKVVETKPTESVQNKELTKPAEVKLEPQVKEGPTVVQEQPQAVTVPVTTDKQSKRQAILAILNNNSTIILAGLIPAIMILLLLMLVKRSKRNKAKNGFVKPEKGASTTGESLNQEDNSSTSDYLNEDMDWKEKFKTYKSQPVQNGADELLTEEVTSDEMFFDETPIQYGMEEEEEEALELEELFSQQNPPKQQSPQEDEGSLEDTANTNEEVYNFEAEIESHEAQDDSDDAIWDEFIGPELTAETSIDDLFSEDDIIEDLEKNIDENFAERNIETAPSAEDIYETYQCTEECANSIESLKPEAEPYFEDHSFVQSSIEETTEEVAAAEDEDETQLSTKSSFQIDETKGFYLINFEGATALVGYINEEIFVLKRFDGVVQGSLKARLNEHTGNAATYMVRVGNFKAIVEVTPQKMNFVLEL